MKLLLVFLAVTGLVASAPTRSLEDDINDILAVLQIDEIAAAIRRYAQSDAEVQEFFRYLQSQEWASLVEEVGNLPTMQAFKQYLLNNGVDLDALLQRIRDFIDSIDVARQGTPRSLRDLFDEILSIVNIDELLAVLSDKLENSEDFQNFYEVISSNTAFEFVEEIRTIEEVQRLAQVLTSWGFDIEASLRRIYGFLGWDYTQFVSVV